jgi:hypothetical protein
MQQAGQLVDGIPFASARAGQNGIGMAIWPEK